VVGELRDGIYEDLEHADLMDPVESTQPGFDLRNEVERTESSSGLPLSDGDLTSDLADVSKLAVPRADLAGNEEHSATLDAGDKVGNWR
jgi:hypothetical protein